MFDDLEEIILDKPLEEATFLDFCKGTPRQRSLKKLKESSLESLKERIGNDDLAEKVFKAFRKCREGYIRIRRQWPSLGEPHEGWTYAFVAGLPLTIDRPDEWFRTSNIEKIDWEGKTFVTRNSVYTFEFIAETVFVDVATKGESIRE